MVSVIIPNYNHANYLEERIQSVLKQTYSNYEIIILDDCSTDDSKNIIEQYRNHDKVSEIIYNDKNSGSPILQWEKGIKAANGNIIWLAESDDTCSPLFLEKLVSTFQSSNSVLTFCHSNVIDQHGNFYINTWQDNLVNNFTLDGKSFISSYLFYKNTIQNASSVIFDKTVSLLALKEQSLLQYKSAGDWLFWTLIALKGKVSYVHESLNYYRQHRENTTSLSILNGTSAKEHVHLFKKFLSLDIIDEKEYFKRRKQQLYAVGSTLPNNIQKEIFKMWDASFWEIIRMKIHFQKMKLKNKFRK